MIWTRALQYQTRREEIVMDHRRRIRYLVQYQLHNDLDKGSQYPTRRGDRDGPRYGLCFGGTIRDAKWFGQGHCNIRPDGKEIVMGHIRRARYSVQDCVRDDSDEGVAISYPAGGDRNGPWTVKKRYQYGTISEINSIFHSSKYTQKGTIHP